MLLTVIMLIEIVGLGFASSHRDPGMGQVPIKEFIYIIDGSSSISAEQFTLQKEMVKQLI